VGLLNYKEELFMFKKLWAIIYDLFNNIFEEYISLDKEDK
jgi:hypothetical protein